MSAIDKTLLAQMIEWRHELHRYPEFGFKEQRSSDFIAEKLGEFGIEVVRNIGKTGLVGILTRGSSSRAIGLRADMDALKIQEQNDFDYASKHPGMMHACGHDGHSAMLLGAIMASESSFAIQLRGQGGHAALPHMGTDTMLAGAQIVVALQSIVSRKLSAIQESAVVSVTEFITDGTVNVIPSEVSIKGDCRAFSDQAVDKIRSSMERIVAGISAASAVEYSFEFTTSFPATINSPEQTEHAVRAARAVLGVPQVDAECEPYTISEDFANMLRVKPGAYGLLGNGGESGSGCALHNPKYDFNDNILASGAAYWVRLVENQLGL